MSGIKEVGKKEGEHPDIKLILERMISEIPLFVAPAAPLDHHADHLAAWLSEFKAPPPAASLVKKVPYREYNNPSPENEEKHSLGVLPKELWLEVYQHLDIRSLLKFINSCKKLGRIANEDEVRERLYQAQEDRRRIRFSSGLDRPLPSQELLPFVDMARATRHNQYVLEEEYDAYNNDPQKGFVMKTSPA